MPALVPVRLWLAIMLATTAYAPAAYVWRYFGHTTTWRGTGLPDERDTWRTAGRLQINLAILAALLALTVFVFTPAAERFAQAPSFGPVMAAAIGAWALASVLMAFATGRIQPFVRGATQTYERDAQPRPYWASVVWNAFLGLALLALPILTDLAPHSDPLEDQCYGAQTPDALKDGLSACNQAIAKHAGSREDLAGLFGARGTIQYRRGAFRQALDDYDEAIRLDPKDPSTRYDRGLVHSLFGDRARAIEDHSAAIRLQPDNIDAYLNRGFDYLNANQLDPAIADFSHVLQLRPKDEAALANRGLAYAWKDDRTRATRDLAAARTLDPANAVMLRGEALLAMNVGDIDRALDRLTQALHSEPRNAWTLAMRARVYRELGEPDKAKADLEAIPNRSAPSPGRDAPTR